MAAGEKMYDPKNPGDRAKLAERVRENLDAPKLREAMDKTTSSSGGEGNEATSTSNED